MANSKFIVKHGLKVGPFEVDASNGNITTTGTLSINGSSPITAASTNTLTNKTISGSNNTLSDIGNASLTNSSVTINGSSLSLGGTLTLDTDDLGEGTSNLYFTTARAESAARGAVSASDAGGLGSFSYNSSTGAFTYTGPSNSDVRGLVSATDAGGLGSFSYDSATGAFTYTGPSNSDVRGLVSANDAGGDGSFSYDSATGVFTYTGPSASEVRAHFSAGTGVTITSGQIAIAQSVATSATPTFAGLTLTGNQTITGDILPSVDNTYSLGSATYMWKDVYVGPGSLYVNGQKVLEESSGNIVVSADPNQNLVLQTSGSGDVELDPTGTGVISFKGPVQFEAGVNLSSSDGNAIGFSNAIAVDSLSSKSANTDLTLSGAGTGKVYINDNAEVSGNMIIQGNLTVQGTTTTVNSETISLADNIIDLNSNFTTGTPTENAGLRVMRGDETATQIRWNETSDIWDFTNDGATYVALVGTSLTQTLTNKTIAAGSNTISGLTNSNLSGSAGITNANLANSSLTVNGTSISLGGSATITASTTNALTIGTGLSGTSFNGSSAVTIAIDSSVVTLTGAQTLTNKTLTSPTMTTPTLGVASATSINKVAITAPATSATLTIADGKTLTASNTLTFTGTDSSSVAFGSGGTVAYTANKLSAFATTTSAELAGVISDETGSGALVFGTSPTFTTKIVVPVIEKSGTDGTGDIGQSGNKFANVYATTFRGVSTTAQYADLAEKYSADAEYEPGTVLCFGGDAEVTECVADMCRKVAGVVTTAPAHLMNSELGGVAAAIALQGRVPCKVVGPVAKGDMMVAAGNGRARAEANPVMGSVIGKALENFEGGEGVIEVAVGRL